jgi:predicted nucleic acid-binding protein
LIVLDSSAAVDYLARRAPGDWVAEQIFAEPTLHAPHVLDVEVVSALRRLVRTASIAEATAAAALARLLQLDVTRYPHLPLIPRMWELRAVASASDAAFVALAESLDAVLVTTDARLARTHGLRVEILAP